MAGRGRQGLQVNQYQISEVQHGMAQETWRCVSNLLA